MLIGSALTAVSFPTIRAMGQLPNQKNVQPNQMGYAPGGHALGQPILPFQSGPYPHPATSGNVPQGYRTPQYPHAVPSAHNRRGQMTAINKDGSVERIEKELGTPFTQEEIQRNMEARQKIQRAVAAIKSPDSDDSTKEESKQLIIKYLKSEFQWDQEGRREQLERLEKQVEQLKKQLTKREESQDKLIELRLQLLENDASGLSFPDSWSNINNNSFPSANPLQDFYTNADPNVLPNGNSHNYGQGNYGQGNYGASNFNANSVYQNSIQSNRSPNSESRRP